MRSSSSIYGLNMYRERGYALLFLLALLGLGLAFVVGGALPNRLQVQGNGGHPEVTARALQQAKEALIAYAATTSDRNSNQAFGYMPLPDMGGHVDSIHRNMEGVAAAGFAGNLHDQIVIGRLPWNTLGLPALKDEYGECLWYAISGSFKNTPTSVASMNWDNLGYLDVRTADGTSSIWGSDIRSRPVAAIFSPGPPLSGQNRANSTELYDKVTNCHGNYDVRNYLDPYSATADTNNIANWLSSDTATGHHALDSAQSVVRPLLGGPLTRFLTTSTNTPGVQFLNDRAIYITSADIFNLVKQRSYYQSNTRRGYINDILNTIATAPCLQGPPYHPPNAPNFPGTLVNRGHFPANCHFTGATDAFVSNWGLHLYYLACADDSNCLSVTLTGANGVAAPPISCPAVVIFGGETGPGQTRDNQADPSNMATATNYLENLNISAYQDGSQTQLAGNAFFIKPATGRASTDVIVCVP